MAEKVCEYPFCPSGATFKQLEDRHEEVKKSFERLESGQEKMINTMMEVATLIADVRNLKDTDDRREKEIANIFARLQTMETTAITKSDLTKAVTIISAVFVIVQVVVQLITHIK